MLVGIHKDQYGKFCPFLQKYEEILDYNKIDHIRLDANEPDFWEKVAKLDLFIFRWKHIDDHHQMAKTIIPIVEKQMGIRCFPDLATCWHYDDNIRQYYLLKQNGFPMIESWIFWDEKQALKWLNTAELPIVFKLKGGAGSNNVILVKSKRQAKKLINRMFGRGIMSGHIPVKDTTQKKDFNLYKTIHHIGGNILRKLRDEDISPFWQVHKNYVLFQKYLPNNEYDTRITIIGSRAFGFRRFIRDNDFRASGSGKIDYNIDKVDKNCIKIAFKVSKQLQFQSMAYDFIYNENNEPEFSEISYTYLDTAIYNCPGNWDSNLNWHEGHYWPQYFQLVDTLNLPELKQPEIKV
jgi:glutathione synthase/RimK-type ligase-like ATP-grasp enzyme